MTDRPDSVDRPIAVVLGTRPEIIKMARITQLLGDRCVIVHTGQHYDEGLSGTFFTEFDMRPPDATIGVGGQSRGFQIGRAIEKLDELFADLRPSAVMVQGDTNAVLSAAVAANAREIPVVHVEAGLRSFDRAMPEEHNRVVADHLSDLCLAPTELNVEHLAAEGIAHERVALTGNPVVEAVERLLPDHDARAALVERYDVTPGGFVLSTMHRPENVDDPEKLHIILSAMVSLPVPVLLPLHPRTAARIAEFGLEDVAAKLRITEPIGFRDFIGLGAEAGLLVSDSGGVQEEVSVYKRPAVVVRRSTERQEVQGTFATRVEPGPGLAAAIGEAWETSAGRASELADLPSPYGDSQTPQVIVDTVEAFLGRD